MVDDNYKIKLECAFLVMKLLAHGRNSNRWNQLLVWKLEFGLVSWSACLYYFFLSCGLIRVKRWYISDRGMKSFWCCENIATCRSSSMDPFKCY